MKVAYSGDNTIITGIRIGTSHDFAFHHEWKKMGEWQDPIVIEPNEYIVGVRGYFGLNDSIKSLGFILMSFQ